MGAFGPACGAVPTDGEGSFAGMADDTAATAASNNPLLSTLVTAVTEADLVDTLNSDGPFTIFAPTNDAFAAIDPEVLAAVLADKDLLTAVLTYHVVGGEAQMAGDLGSAGMAETNGTYIRVGMIAIFGFVGAKCYHMHSSLTTDAKCYPHHATRTFNKSKTNFKVFSNP